MKVNRKCEKNILKLPHNARLRLAQLLEDLEASGPVQSKYPNYSKLAKDKYHCHLSYHWVACWTCEDGEYVVEVYYVGSRESAPY